MEKEQKTIVDKEVNQEIDHHLIEKGNQLNDWFIFRDSRHFGPLSFKQMTNFLLKAYISVDHYVWRPGLKDWVPIKEVDNFRAYGSDNIQPMTDDEFSRKVKLGPVDKIQFEESGLQFAEDQEVQYIDKETANLSAIQKSFYYFRQSVSSLFHQMMEKLNVPEENREGWKKASLGVGLVAVLAVIIFMNRPDQNAFVKDLPSDLQNKLYQISSLPEKTDKASLMVFEKNPELVDPVLVGATNLPVGSRIRINIEGDTKTLLGVYRFSKIIEMNLSSKIFQTDAIRATSGQYIPPGIYTVAVNCLSCPKENVEIFSERYSFGIKDQTKYLADLTKFQSEARESARLELSELKDLGTTLEEQYQKSSISFTIEPKSSSVKKWNTFSAGWLSTQKKLVDLFDQIEPAEFKTKLFYLPLYESYSDLTRKIFELHVFQDKIMNGEDKSEQIISAASDLSQDIKLNLSFLKSQVDLMNLNYNGSKGLPSQDGLKTKTIK